MSFSQRYAQAVQAARGDLEQALGRLHHDRNLAEIALACEVMRPGRSIEEGLIRVAYIALVRRPPSRNGMRLNAVVVADGAMLTATRALSTVFQEDDYGPVHGALTAVYRKIRQQREDRKRASHVATTVSRAALHALRAAQGR